MIPHNINYVSIFTDHGKNISLLYWSNVLTVDVDNECTIAYFDIKISTWLCLKTRKSDFLLGRWRFPCSDNARAMADFHLLRNIDF